jgi:bla regulator protein blaR1
MLRVLLPLFMLISPVTFGQAPNSRLEFDVVDIKPNVSGSPNGVGEILPGGQFRAINIPVKEIIKFAYNLRDDAIVAAPTWVDSERYDIVGKAPAAGSEETFWRSDSALQFMRLYYTDQTFRQMVQSLLADRFKLSVHSDKKPTTVYALTVAKGGPKLQRAVESGKPDCLRTVDQQIQAVLTCKNMTMADLGRALQLFAPGYANHEVIDATGLEGTYDFTLKWVGVAVVDQGGMTIPEALNKLLGLRWEERKQPMPTIVIDHIEKPSDN